MKEILWNGKRVKLYIGYKTFLNRKNMNLLSFPWDNGEKPVLKNSAGYEWYVDKFSSDYAKTKLGPGHVVFFIKKNDFITRGLVNRKQELLADSQSMEDLAVKIDMIALAKEL